MLQFMSNKIIRLFIVFNRLIADGADEVYKTDVLDTDHRINPILTSHVWVQYSI
jgi:hypothetical protein